MKEQERLSPKERTEQILCAAVKVAKAGGILSVTRESVAAKAGCSVGLVTLRYSSMALLRRALMRRAIRDNILSIIAQGIAMGDKTALAVSQDLRERACQTLT